MTLQESLANAKVSTWQQCVPLEKTSTANQRKEHNIESALKGLKCCRYLH